MLNKILLIIFIENNIKFYVGLDRKDSEWGTCLEGSQRGFDHWHSIWSPVLCQDYILNSDPGVYSEHWKG